MKTPNKELNAPKIAGYLAGQFSDGKNQNVSQMEMGPAFLTVLSKYAPEFIGTPYYDYVFSEATVAKETHNAATTATTAEKYIFSGLTEGPTRGADVLTLNGFRPPTKTNG